MKIRRVTKTRGGPNSPIFLTAKGMADLMAIPGETVPANVLNAIELSDGRPMFLTNQDQGKSAAYYGLVPVGKIKLGLNQTLVFNKKDIMARFAPRDMPIAPAESRQQNDRIQREFSAALDALYELFVDRLDQQQSALRILFQEQRSVRALAERMCRDLGISVDMPSSDRDAGDGAHPH